MERYIKPIAEIPEHKRELWSQLAFNLRDPNRTNRIDHWEGWFKVSTHLYLIIDPDRRTHSYTTTRNHTHVAKVQPLTLELLQVLNLLKMTGEQ